MFVVDSDFWLGVAVATIVLLVLNWIIGSYRGFMKRISAPRSAQAVVQKTGKTPREVVNDSNKARLQLFFWLLILLIGLFVLYEVFAMGRGNSLLVRFFG